MLSWQMEQCDMDIMFFGDNYFASDIESYFFFCRMKHEYAISQAKIQKFCFKAK